MNTKILTFVFAAFLASPLIASANEPGQMRKDKVKAYRDQQKTENKAFRETLKDMPQEQREAAMINHRNTQFTENLSNLATMHQQHMAEMQAKLAANNKLTDAQKQEILSKSENEYQQRVDKMKAQHTQNINFAEQLEHDTSLSPEQKKEKMKAYIQQKRSEHQAEIIEKKNNREVRREEFRKKNSETESPK